MLVCIEFSSTVFSNKWTLIMKKSTMEGYFMAVNIAGWSQN